MATLFPSLNEREQYFTYRTTRGKRGNNARLAMRPTKATKVQEFVAHGSAVNCLQLGRKSGSVMATGGDDKKVNVWAIGKPNAIMVS